MKLLGMSMMFLEMPMKLWVMRINLKEVSTPWQDTKTKSKGRKINSKGVPMTFKEISIMCMEFITRFLGTKIASKGIKMRFMEISTK